MRSLYTKDELLIQTAKKKPRLQAYLDRIDSLDEKTIDNLNEALWIKEALKILKQTNLKGQKARKQEFITEFNEKERQNAELAARAKYETRIWTSEITFVSGATLAGRGGWEVEIKPGEPFLIKDSNIIVLSGDFYRLTTSNMLKMNDNSKFLMEMTIQEYFNYYAEEYSNKIL